MEKNPLQKLKDDAREEFDKRYKPFSVEGDHSQFTDGVFIPDVERAHDFLDTLIEKVVAAVEEEVVPNQRIVGMSNPPATDIGNSDKHIGWNACRAETLEAFRNFRGL